MTFNISRKGVNNTNGTTARFNSGGTVKVRGDFQNSGKVEIDIRADMDILGSVINSGDFSIKDYTTEQFFQILKYAIQESSGESREFLQNTYKSLGEGKEKEATTYFRSFLGYIKNHPELITSTIQMLLQIFKP